MPDDVDALVERARALFLDRSLTYGCAEATYLVLCEAWGVGEPGDSSPAMALNGGVAYSGATCGAITGAAMALGLLAGQRIEEHKAAKRVARELTMRLMDEFLAAHGATDCRDLIGIDLRAPGGHRAYLRSGAWEGPCMRQVETAIRAVAPLVEPGAWDAAVREVLRAG